MSHPRTKADRKAAYCAAVADEVAQLCPSLSGRIDWDRVAHGFYSGADARDVAACLISDHQATRAEYRELTGGA